MLKSELEDELLKANGSNEKLRQENAALIEKLESKFEDLTQKVDDTISTLELDISRAWRKFSDTIKQLLKT